MQINTFIKIKNSKCQPDYLEYMKGLKNELYDVESKNIQIKKIDFGTQKPEVSEKVFTKIRKNKIIVHENYFQDLKEGL